MVGETTDDRKRNDMMSYVIYNIFIGVCSSRQQNGSRQQVIETTVISNDIVLKYEIMVIYMFYVTTQELGVLGGLSIEMLLLLR